MAWPTAAANEFNERCLEGGWLVHGSLFHFGGVTGHVGRFGERFDAGLRVIVGDHRFLLVVVHLGLFHALDFLQRFLDRAPRNRRRSCRRPTE